MQAWKKPPKCGMSRAIVSLAVLTLWASPAVAEESSYLGNARSAAKASPRDAAAQIALGEALLEARLLDEAKRAFTQASRLPEGRVGGTYGLAKIQMAQDKIPAARNTCKRVLSAAKGSPLGHICEGQAFLAWQRSSRAIEGFERALKLASNNTEALIGMGDVERARSNVSKAESFYRNALKSSPGSSRAHLGLGKLYLSQDKMREAERELRAAIKSSPGLAEPHYHLGVVLGNSSAGVGELRKATEIRPTWGEALEALGQALARKGSHAEAIKVLNRAIKANTNLAGAHQQLGLSHSALKQWPQAETSLRTAIKLVPSLSKGVLTLGDVLAEQGLHDEALEHYQKARNLSPRDAQVAIHTGKLYRRLARNTPARAQFRKALELDPNLAAAHVALGDISFEQENWEEARTHYLSATKAKNQRGVSRQHLTQRLQQLKRR